MKTNATIFKFNLLVLSSIFLLASCSSSNQQAFQKRKYQPFFVKNKTIEPFEKKEQSLEKEETKMAFSGIARSESVDTEKTSSSHERVIDEEETMTVKPLQVKLNVKSAIAERLIEKKVEKVLEEVDFSKKERFQAIEKITSKNNKSYADDVELILYLILAILLPPLAVYLLFGLDIKFWISILLTLLFWFPGLVFALYHVLNENGKI